MTITEWLDRAPHELICETLAQFMTERRIARIDQVIESRISNVIVVIEDLHDPHNVSAVLRTCECMGVQNVAVLEGASTFRSHPQVSQGSHKWLHVRRFRQSENAIRWLKDAGISIFASSLEPDSVPFDECRPLPEKIALMFGNEHEGLSKEVISKSDVKFILPMKGFTESYNVSVAVALTLSELFHSEFKPRHLTHEQKWELRAEWYMKSVKNSHRILRRLLPQYVSSI